jgi:L-asparaginase II
MVARLQLIPCHFIISPLAKAAKTVGPAQKILHALSTSPRGHTGEPNLQQFQEAGKIITKQGVHGIMVASLPELELGFALKVLDGSPLPAWPVFIEALARTGLLPDTLASQMRQTLCPKIETRKGKIVGQIRIAF